MELIKKKKEKEKLNHSFMFKWCMVKGVPCIEFSVWCYTYNKNKSTVYEVEKALLSNYSIKSTILHFRSLPFLLGISNMSLLILLTFKEGI